MTKHYQALISAPSKEEASNILDVLLEKHIVAGGLITHGPSRYWWNGKIEEREYYNISTFIPESKKALLISEVKAVSSDKTPIIALLPMEGSQDFLDWIDKSMIVK
jgi:uncharacterized protein involved in tolerance to divalent cations